MLKAGMTRVDITPPQGLELAGYPHYPRYNTGAHDPLWCACMYLNNGENEVAMVTLDLLFFSKKYVAAVREKVNAACGIPQGNIMISCSHTHSGPWASGYIDSESLMQKKEQPMEYINDIIVKISDAIVKAKAEAFDASFTYGTAVCGAESGVGGNRRMPGGPHDPLVSVMAIKDTSDKIRGMMVNYTLHPTFIHEWSNVCTADYPCYVKLELEEQEPGVIVGFAQGTSGNQSSRYYRQGESYDEAERVGRVLGKAAHTVLDKAVWQKDFPIRVSGETMKLEIRSFGTEEDLREQVAHDKAIYEDLYARYGQSTNREEYYLWQNANLKLLGSENQLDYVIIEKNGIRFDLREDEDPAEVQVFNLGGCCVIGIPGETFVEYGLYMKAMAGFKTVIVNELTNGCLPGYLYTPESLVTGGYETDTSMMGPEFGKHLVETVLKNAALVK